MVSDYKQFLYTAANARSTAMLINEELPIMDGIVNNGLYGNVKSKSIRTALLNRYTDINQLLMCRIQKELGFKFKLSGEETYKCCKVSDDYSLLRNIVTMQDLPIGNIKDIIHFKTIVVGNFFPYENTSPFDLTRYQITTLNKSCNGDVYDKILREHCLVYSIEPQLTSYDETYALQFLREMVIDRRVTSLTSEHLRRVKPAMLECISGKFKRTIIVHKLKNRSSTNAATRQIKTVYGQEFEGTTPINLACYKDHYFIYEQTDIKAVAAKLLPEILRLEPDITEDELKTVSGIEKGQLKRRSRAPFIDSLNLFKVLDTTGYFKSSDHPPCALAIDEQIKETPNHKK